MLYAAWTSALALIIGGVAAVDVSDFRRRFFAALAFGAACGAWGYYATHIEGLVFGLPLLLLVWLLIRLDVRREYIALAAGVPLGALTAELWAMVFHGA